MPERSGPRSRAMTTTLYHCSDSAGLGAFISSVVGAYAISVLSNSTFVLGSNCMSEASRLNREVARHFRFDVRAVRSLAPKALVFTVFRAKTRLAPTSFKTISL